MGKYAYLFSARGADGNVIMFKSPCAGGAVTGDFIMYGGEMFEILRRSYECLDSDTMLLVNDIIRIRDADAIFCCRWEKEEQDV